MSEQSYGTAPSRNTSRAASGSGVLPGEVPTPSAPSPTAPSTGNGQQPGSGNKGFDGALIPGKVSV